MALFLMSTRKENFEMGKRRERKFEDKIRGREQRKRKPVVLLVAEGHNKTEKLCKKPQKSVDKGGGMWYYNQAL